MAEGSIIPMRRCNKCGTEKPDTAENFYRFVKRGKVAFRRRCQVCHLAVARDLARKRWAADPDRHRIRQRHYLIKNKERVNERQREYRASNPDRAREWDRRNTVKNKAAGSEYQKRKWSAQDKKMASSRVKAWKKANPGKTYAHWKRTYEKHKPKHAARTKRWRQSNPEACAANRDRRRAREWSVDGAYTKDDVLRLLREHGRFCFYCSTALTKFHVDHFIPLSRGGSNHASNIRLACPHCNWSKGTKMPWEWMPERFKEYANGNGG